MFLNSSIPKNLYFSQNTPVGNADSVKCAPGVVDDIINITGFVYRIKYYEMRLCLMYLGHSIEKLTIFSNILQITAHECVFLELHLLIISW